MGTMTALPPVANEGDRSIEIKQSVLNICSLNLVDNLD